jgi:iron complex transport system ATP-binding protein
VSNDKPIGGLVADTLSVAYDDRVIVDGLSLQIPTGRITVIAGANASGKPRGRRSGSAGH